MNRKILIITILVFVIGVVGGVGFTVLRKSSKPQNTPEAAHAAAPEKPGKTVPLEEFLVNLADTAEPHYLKVTVVLEVQETPEIDKQIETNTPMLRDALITCLSRNRFNALLKPAGKEALKKSLKVAANRVMGEGVVKNVFFTSFAMQ